MRTHLVQISASLTRCGCVDRTLARRSMMPTGEEFSSSSSSECGAHAWSEDDTRGVSRLSSGRPRRL